MPELVHPATPHRRAPARTGRPRICRRQRSPPKPATLGSTSTTRAGSTVCKPTKKPWSPPCRAPAPTRDGRPPGDRGAEHIDAIRQCAADGLTATEAAEKLGVHARRQVYNVDVADTRLRSPAKAPPLTREQALAAEARARCPAQSRAPRCGACAQSVACSRPGQTRRCVPPALQHREQPLAPWTAGAEIKSQVRRRTCRQARELG